MPKKQEKYIVNSRDGIAIIKEYTSLTNKLPITTNEKYSKDIVMSLNTYYQNLSMQLNSLYQQYNKEKHLHIFQSPKAKQLKLNISSINTTMVNINKQLSILSSDDNKESRFNLLFDIHKRHDKQDIYNLLHSHNMLSNISIAFVGILSSLIILVLKLFHSHFNSDHVVIKDIFSFHSLNQQRNSFWLSLSNSMRFILASIRAIF